MDHVVRHEGADLDAAALTRDAALILLAQGANHLDGGDPEAALVALAAVAHHAPAELAGRGALGAAEACARLGRDGDAETWLARAIEHGDSETRFLALRKSAVEAVRTGDLQGALAAYQRAERDAPNRVTRAEIASRIGWLTQETGGSPTRARRAFRRARGEELFAHVPRALVIVTALLSVVTLLLPDVAVNFALLKTYQGSDVLTSMPWTLFTVTFVHGGIQPPLDAWALHLGFNLIALDLGASLVYRLYGAPRLILWYVIGAVGASLTSAIFLPQVYSVGASGGIFALFGVALGAEWAHRPLIEQGARYALSRIGFLIAVNLAIGFGFLAFGGGIDNAAHIGGLVVGLALGGTITPTRAEPMRRRWSAAVGARGGELAIIGILVMALAATFLNWVALANLRASLPI